VSSNAFFKVALILNVKELLLMYTIRVARGSEVHSVTIPIQPCPWCNLP